jgi:hypothetical protein
MAFIGNTVQTQGFIPATDTFSGNGSTTAFTLSRPVASVQQVQAVISNVVQDPNSAYTVSGNTITFTSAPPSGTNNIYVRYTSLITQTLAPGLGTVGTAQLGTITNIWSGNSSLTLQTGTTPVTAMTINNSTGIITGNGRNLSPAIVPAGTVIQTQWYNFATNYTGTSASYVQITAFNQTFTPLYATSKVYVTFNTGINLICDGNVALTRNGSIIKDTWFGSSRQDDQYDYPQASGFYLDSPGTTSTVTYGIQARAGGCGNTIRIGGSDNHQSFTFMEIAA